MNIRSLRNNKEESRVDPRYLNQSTIKNIEDIANPGKEGQDKDVKIWMPLKQQKQNG